VLEFKGSGRGRYMVRERNPGFDGYGGDLSWQVLPETAIWSDYDGDEIYGDYVVDPNDGSVIEKTAYLPGIGQIDVTSGNVTYYHADHLGTMRASTDGYGDVLGMYVYTAFGEIVHVDGTVGTRYQYAGESGYESGLLPAIDLGGGNSIPGLPWQHVGHRWYEPSTGRFLQRDPIGILGGLNVYAYVDSNPVLSSDPSGLQWWQQTRDAAGRFGPKKLIYKKIPGKPGIGIAYWIACKINQADYWLEGKPYPGDPDDIIWGIIKDQAYVFWMWLKYEEPERPQMGPPAPPPPPKEPKVPCGPHY